MSTIEEVVHEILDGDIFLRVTLKRNIQNKQALARWVQKEHALDAGVDSIVDAVDTYEPGTDSGLLSRAREAMSAASFSANVPVSALNVQRRESTHESLGSLFDIVDGDEEDAIRIVPAGGTFSVVVDRDHRDEVVEEIGARWITGPGKDLVEVVVKPTGSSEPGGDILGLAITTLNAAGITVRHAMSGVEEQLLLVDESDASDAYEVLTQLKFGLSGEVDAGP